MENIFKLKKNEVEMEPGEERLAETYNFKVVSGKKEVVLFGIDGGSTQTRAKILDMKQEGFDETYTIPSVFSTLKDERELKCQSDKLFDRMDSVVISHKNPGVGLFEKERVLRGTLQKTSNLSKQKISSTSQKIDNPNFYINVIDALGYSLFLKYVDEIPESFDVYMGIALPPDDISSTKNIAKFRNRVLGVYSFKFGENEIKINIKSCIESTEPEALIKAYYAIQEIEIPELVLQINSGGRSFGLELLLNGDSIPSAQKSLIYGGTQLKELLAQNIVEDLGGREPEDALIERALRTGLLKRNSNTIDVKEHCKKSKNQFAERIYSDVIAKIFDQQTEYGIEAVNVITVSGRLFSKDEYDYSLAKPLQALFKAIAPDVEFMVIEDNTIPFGCLMNAFNNFGGVLEASEVASENLDVSEKDAVTLNESSFLADLEGIEEVTSELK